MRLYRRGKFWWFYFTDPAGSEHRASTRQTDRRRAEHVAKDAERRACDPTYQAAHETSLADGIGNFKAAVRRRGRAEGTLDMYDVKTRHLARLLGADTRLVKIGAREVDGYIETREEEGASRSTIYKEIVALRGLLKVARRRGEYDKEPSQVFPVGYGSGYKPRKRVLSQEEAARLLVALPDDVMAWLAAALASGGRLSELARMRRADIDLDAARLIMRGSKTEAARATLPIVSVMRPLLALALAAGRPGPLLLPTWGRVRKALDKVRVSLSIQPFSPNDLRRTFLTWLVEAGVPIDLVAKMARHRDTRMVELVYGRPSAEAVGLLVETALERCTENVREPGKKREPGNTGDSKKPGE